MEVEAGETIDPFASCISAFADPCPFAQEQYPPMWSKEMQWGYRNPSFTSFAARHRPPTALNPH